MARAAKRQNSNGGARGSAGAEARAYQHADKDMPARPEIGAAPRFRARKPPATYRYDSSLAPALDWDSNPARETAAFLLDCIEQAARLPPPHAFPQPRELKGADGAVLLAVAGLQDALSRLRAMQRPFLDWAGKAERAGFEVPTLPLFVHERLSTAAIVKTLEGHRKTEAQGALDLFGDPRRPLADQVRAFQHRDRWVNRMILGDSLVVMNSLLRFEGLGGQVQCIYIDPPYGVKFGSNFQPFVRKRDVSHNDDADMTREPEMVQAYRDTWELGLHSYLTYLRDRLLVARDLLTPSGSVFVQISDDNLHHVREVMDEVFGAENFSSIVTFRTTANLVANGLGKNSDYLLWYARDQARLKYRQIFQRRTAADDVGARYTRIEQADGTRRFMTSEERRDWSRLPDGTRVYRHDNLTSQGPTPTGTVFFEFDGAKFHPGASRHWTTTRDGLQRLALLKRLGVPSPNSLAYVRYFDDFPFAEVPHVWTDTQTGAFTDDKTYVVQTSTKVIERCLLMTTDPGDLVLDPTCGSGTTAYVAEQWGRRWITVDTSRVPLALARQRLLTATYPWYCLKDDAAGPGSGFVYARKKNKKGEEVGGIVPHVTLKSIANNEPPAEEVLVDRPEEDGGITRVAGPFVVEATLPTPAAVEDDGAAPAQPASPSPAERGRVGEGAVAATRTSSVPAQAGPDAPSPALPRSAGEGEASRGAAPHLGDTPGDHVLRMIEVLRRSPTLALPGNRKVRLANIRRPARSFGLSAEAAMEEAPSPQPSPAQAREREQAGKEGKEGTIPVAILFGPADGPVTAKAVLDAAKEANVKGFRHLFVIGFAITAEARADIDAGEDALGLAATYVSTTMDLQMGDLLKTSRASQIFAVCGLPEIAVTRLPDAAEDGTPRWQVKLLGLDVFDPITMNTDHKAGNDVPCWMLDTSWNGMAFHADQVFFPRTGAWDNLRKALRATHDETVWAHLAGDTSAPFAAPAGSDIAVKVLDDRGNELPVIRRLGA